MALGTALTDQDLKVVAWPAGSPVPGAIADPKNAVGRGLLTAVLENEPITVAKIASSDVGSGLPPAIPRGMRAMSVKVNDVIGVAGFVLPGTRVDVVVTFRRTRDSMTRTAASNVQVLAAGTRQDQGKPETDSKQPNASTVVTLIVTPQDAERIALAQSEGEIMLILRNPLDNDTATTSGVKTESRYNGRHTRDGTRAIDAARRAEISELPVIRTTRQDVWRYLGFKHVNGPSTWGSYAKAQYVALVHNSYAVPLEEIAKQIGDYNCTVLRMYRGLMVIEQAERAGVFDRRNIAKSDFYFNYIYTGIEYPGIRKFLGIDGEKEPSRNPVPRSKITNLKKLCEWLYGNESSSKPSLIKSQNPDLKRLDEVLLSEKGVRALSDGLPLSVAHDISFGDERLFRQALQQAKQALQKAHATLTTGFSGKDTEAIALANDIEDLATDLVAGMMEKRKRKKEKRKSRGRLQCRRFLNCPGSRWSHLYPRRTGNRRCFYQGVRYPARESFGRLPRRFARTRTVV
jgi:Flp pilus assembly protein CpaB